MEKGLIEIIGLKVSSLIGVPDEERLRPQDLLIDVTIKPSNYLYQLDDKIENTVDYFMVYELIKSISSSGERKLIETLAEEIINNIIEANIIHSKNTNAVSLYNLSLSTFTKSKSLSS